MKALFLLIYIFTFAFSQELSDAKISKLVKKGERISYSICDKDELLTLKLIDLSISNLIEKLKKNRSCGGLTDKNYQALGYFLLSKKGSSVKKITVPKSAKCPVCGMFVFKYPKWSARITIDKKHLYFDGIKDMMKYYIFSKEFPYNRTEINQITVSDYYKLEAIDANSAFYVIGSDILGPMGNELIAFKTEKEAKNFMRDHNGVKILNFKEITPHLIMGLDGIEY